MVSLNADLPPIENADFHWRFSCCMIDMMRAMMALHENDIEQAMIFVSLWARLMDPTGGDYLSDQPARVSEISQSAENEPNGLRLHEIARIVRMNRTTVRRKIERLLEKGLITCPDGLHYTIAPRDAAAQDDLSAMLGRQWQSYRRLTENLVNDGIIKFSDPAQTADTRRGVTEKVSFK